MSRFQPDSLAYGLGAMWAVSGKWPVLVRIDPATLRAELATALPGPEDSSDRKGPTQITVGAGAVWAASPGQQRVVRVDPLTGRASLIELPFRPFGIAAGAGGLYAVGDTGDGRLAAISADGGLRVRQLGTGLRLVATAGDPASDPADSPAGDLIWTVDDPAATVLAVDASTLEVVATFSNVGRPDSLLPGKSSASYISWRESEYVDADGFPGRHTYLGRGGPFIDLLHLDAASGELSRLTEHCPGTEAVASQGGIWVADHRDRDLPYPELLSADPISTVHLMDGAGTTLRSVDVPGQLSSLATDGVGLWVTGFRRTRQQDVTTVLDRAGEIVGEVDFSSVDVTPWLSQPAPRKRWPEGEFLTRTARSLTDSLTGPWLSEGRFRVSPQPPINPAFRLDCVEILPDGDDPRIAVLFRWSGHDDLFGAASTVTRALRRGTPDERAGFIVTHLQETLLARGIEQAVRDTRDGITWLRWPNSAL